MKKQNKIIFSILGMILICFLFICYKLSFSLSRDQIEKIVIRGEPIAILIVIFFIVIFLFLERKKILKLFSKIRGKTFVFLILIFILGLFLRNAAPHGHRLYFDEDIYLDMAKQIQQDFRSCLCDFGDENTCFRCEMMKWPAGHPFLFSLPFFIFGVDEEIAFQFASFVSSISVILIFFLTYLLTKKEKIALYSSLFLAILPIYILWSTTATAEPTVLFFSLLSMIFLLIYKEIKSDKTFFLAILGVFLVLTAKWEAVVFCIPVLIFLFFFLKEDIFQKIVKPNVLIGLFLVIILTFPHFLHFFYFEHTDSWGASTKEERFSFDVFKQNLNANTKFWFNYKFWDKNSWIQKELFHPIFFTLIAVSGGIFLILNKKWKIFLILFLWFFLFFFLYSSFYAGSVIYGWDARYILLMVPSFCIFAAFGLFLIENGIKWVFKKFLNNKRINENYIILTTLFIPILFFLPYFKLIGIPYSKVEEGSDARLYHDYVTKYAKELQDDCYFLSHVTSIYTTLNKKHIQIWYIDRPEFNQLLQKGQCIILDEGYWCQPDIAGTKEICIAIHNRYNLKQVSQFYNSKHNEYYTFYKILSPK